MSYQLELKPLHQRLQDQLDRAVLPGRLFLNEHDMAEVIAALKENELNEVTLAAVVFGDNATAGKQWRDIIARVREYQAHIVELVAVCDQLATTAVCQACGTRIPNTEADRLDHVAHCAKRPADNPLALQLQQALNYLDFVPGDSLVAKCKHLSDLHTDDTLAE